MDALHVSGIRCYAFHGCIDEEAKAGGYFTVDISVTGDWSTAAKTDELSDAVDYVTLSKVAIEEMKVRSKMIETVAYRIAERIKKEHVLVKTVNVSITKERAPIELDVASVKVSVSI